MDIRTKNFVQSCNKQLYEQAIATLTKAPKKSYEEKVARLMEAMLDSRKMQKYAQERTPIIDLYVRANTFATEFFETKILRGREMPSYITKGSPQQIPVYYIADWGMPQRMMWTDTMGIVDLPLGMISTDKVLTPKRSLIQGTIDKSEELNKDLAYRLGDKLDDMAWVALNGAIKAFDDNVFILDPKIKNPPSTNDLDFSADCKGRITKDFYKGIWEHFNRLNLKIGNVYIPSVRAGDHIDWVSVSGFQVGDVRATETIPANVQAEIWRSGGLNLGAQWIPEITPTNTLEGEEAGNIYCWVVATQPVGYNFTKPELDLTVTKDAEDPRFYSTYTIKTVSYVIPDPYRVRVARVKIG